MVPASHRMSSSASSSPTSRPKPSGKGTGLGLPVSREILDHYGSRLEVETRDGEGTRGFSFRFLPVVRDT